MNMAVCLVASFLYSLLFVFSWREKRRVNRVFSAYLLGMGLWTSTSVMWFADFPVLGDLPWLQIGMFFSIIAWMLMCLLSVAILGLDSVPAVRVGLWAVYCLGGLLLIGDLSGQLIHVTRIEGGHFDVHFGGLIYLFFALAGLSGVALTFLFARAGAKTDDHNQRNRLLYFAMSNILIIIGGLANLSPQLRSFPVDVLFDVIAALLMAYAIYRYQLLDITLVVRKGLLYLIPTAIIGVLYFVIIFFIVQVLHAFVGYQILLLSLLIAVVSVMLVQPLRERAQAWVDRLFFREKYDAYQMLQKLSRGATSIIHLEELLNMIFEELAERMHIARMGVFLKEEKAEEFRLAAQRGLDEELAHLSLRNDHAIVNWLAREKGVLTRHEMDMDPHFKAYWGEEREELERMGAELFIPLRAKDELVGILAVGPKLSEVTYLQDDQLTLATLADQVAISIENARLYKEAQKELAERKRAEEELREHREHLGELVVARTAELDARVAEVEQLNQGMINLLDDLQAATRTATRTAQRLEVTNDELEAFVHSVSHDLRAPLRHADRFAQLLLQREAARLEPTSARYLQNIVEAAGKMGQLIDDLLALSRTSQTEMKLRRVAPNEIVEQVRQGLEPAIEGRRITWEIAPLPAVQADPGLLRIVWTNLLSNAVKYTAPRPQTRIEIGATPPDDEGQVTFFIRDDGVGFNPQYAHKLFGVFQRLHRDEEFEGTGIGLATVRRIIHRHGGRVWAEGEVDHGATFYFTLRS